MAATSPDINQPLPRRLILASALCAAGCAPERTPPDEIPTPSPQPRSAVTSSAPPPSPSPSPSWPTRESIETRYSDAKPDAWGLDLPGVVQRTASDAVALTFDACGGQNGSGYDEALIEMLRRERVPATLFLNSRWIQANRAVAEELVADELFTIGNHGTRHLPLSVSGQEAYGIPGTTSPGEVYDEISGCQELLTSLMGKAPRFFRPGTAFYDDIALRIIDDLRLIPVGFDINSDAGATFSASQVAQETRRASAGSICIAHFNRPDSGTADGMMDVLPRMRDGGVSFAKLEDLL